MCSYTTPEKIKASKKQRCCDWCLEHIEIGQPYERWRGFDARDAYTVRVHPECAVASNRLVRAVKAAMAHMQDVLPPDEIARNHYSASRLIGELFDALAPFHKQEKP